MSAPFGLYITCRNLSHHQRQVDLKNLQRKIAGTRTHCVDPDDLKRSSNIPLHPASIPKPLTLNRFHKLARSATRSNGQLLADFIASWVKLNPHYFCVFGAPFQADAQMIDLCRKYKRWIRGVMRSARVCFSVCNTFHSQSHKNIALTLPVMTHTPLTVTQKYRTRAPSDDSDVWLMGAPEWHSGKQPLPPSPPNRHHFTSVHNHRHSHRCHHHLSPPQY